MRARTPRTSEEPTPRGLTGTKSSSVRRSGLSGAWRFLATFSPKISEPSLPPLGIRAIAPVFRAAPLWHLPWAGASQ